MENIATKHGLGSTWRIQCENESCTSYKTNSVFKVLLQSNLGICL